MGDIKNLIPSLLNGKILGELAFEIEVSVLKKIKFSDLILLRHHVKKQEIRNEMFQQLWQLAW